jgi:serine/threonine-protein kinase
MPPESDEEKKRTSASGLRPLPSEPKPGANASPALRRPAPPRYGAGDVIAEKYRLGRKLGEGGMGEVWLAHNETLDIDVAIKLIRGEQATAEMADRLLNEARAAARLGHPAIVRINDFGKTSSGDPFIVMELLDGEDLAKSLERRGRLSATKAVRTLLPIAHALTVAHTKGIVHRDLKPENVYLAKDEEGQIHPKLVDFGVAKLEQPHSNRLTQTGALLGSPLYMSPEQARGDDVDHRADIWALGVVLYETITGRPPFEGKNYNAILYSIIANPPTSIVQLQVGDEELWSILERALQKDPDRRWYSMRDFGEALSRWLVDKNVLEDITGASLQSTWLNWKRDEDALSPGASLRPRDEEGAAPVALPPVPSLEGIRSREITERRQRQDRRPMVVAAVVGIVVFVAVLASLVALKRSHRAAEAERPAPAGVAATGSVVVNAEPAAAPPDPAHERAVEQALADPAPVESATAAAPHAHVPPKSTPRSGYRPRPTAARTLKNPFH